MATVYRARNGQFKKKPNYALINTLIFCFVFACFVIFGNMYYHNQLVMQTKERLQKDFPHGNIELVEKKFFIVRDIDNSVWFVDGQKDKLIFDYQYGYEVRKWLPKD